MTPLLHLIKQMTDFEKELAQLKERLRRVEEWDAPYENECCQCEKTGDGEWVDDDTNWLCNACADKNRAEAARQNKIAAREDKVDDVLLGEVDQLRDINKRLHAELDEKREQVRKACNKIIGRSMDHPWNYQVWVELTWAANLLGNK